MKLCSACLLGIKCAYDGKDRKNLKIWKLSEKETLIPICPEELGGLSTPRETAGIYKSSGENVLKGKAKVVDKNGKDVTKNFLKGAKETLKIAKQYKIKEFIGKQRSPSCGCGQIYDGTFTKNIVSGDGVTVALLKKNGIKVTTEEDM